VIAPENRFAVLLPLGSVSVAGLVNLLYLTPKVGRVIKERFLQGLSFPPKSLLHLKHRCMCADWLR
jgi:hypothetical protein